MSETKYEVTPANTSSTAIDYNAIPGTSHLVDSELNHSDEHETEKGVILIPTPSDDPNDPLNWSPKRKAVQMFCIVLYCFGGSIPGCVIYSIITDIAADPTAHITASQLNAGTGYSFLFLGLGGLIFLPLAQAFGKRPIYIFSIFATLAIDIMQPFTTGEGYWYGSKILHGLFYSVIESLPPITVSDMYFEHERATAMGIYGVALYSSNYAAPMLAGFVDDALGWRWVIWLSLIFGLVCAIGMFFLVEETNYDRKLRVRRQGGTLTAITSNGEEKNPAVVTSNADGEMETADNLANQTSIIETDDENFTYPPRKSYTERLSFRHGAQKKQFWKDFFIMPWKMVQFPIVLYSGFLYGVSLFFYSILNTTESLILSAPPYNFSASICGLCYLSAVIFVFLVYPIAGWSTDYIKIKIARKHGGISQAEDRLWILVIYMILGPAALILWGVGAAHGINWFGVIVGLGLMAGLCIIGCVSSLSYVLDCYPQMNVPAIAVCIVIRNCMNFGLDYGITPFLDACGVQNTFIACAFICMGCIGTFLIMEKTGLYWRKKGRKAYWSMVDYYRTKGVIS